ncbi:MAG: hypothetical protein C0501_03890 [Isosphaera sp.]|nr:hypothetical protein [Isosphaera sp.]
MLRPSLFLLLAAVAAGCSPKPGAGPGDPPADAAFTLKIVDEQPGQKVAVVRSQTVTSTVTAGAVTQTQKAERRAEYVETVQEVAGDAPRPTRLVREYTTALASGPKGGLQPLSYSGKAVEIRKAGPKAGYTFTVGGKPLPAAEAADFAGEFGKAGPRTADLLPKAAVKVGEEWQPDPAVVQNLAALTAADFQAVPDRDRSTLTGKLARVYQKDGRQWGVVEFRLRVTFAAGATGAVTVDATLDVPIDGSARAGTSKRTLKAELTGQDPKRGEVRQTVDGVQEQTVTPPG